ncbi:MAG: type I 3-dehydroquinate dehydratase [Patescibacteria group bacterium]|jgi:3-dehydroquinate dehydratase type I
MICIVITNPSQIKTANKTAANLLELRTDLYKIFSLSKLVKQCQKPVIVTIKNQDKQLLQEALNLNVAYIDIDYKNKLLLNYFEKNNKNNKTKLIISYHNFSHTPSFKQLDRLVKSGVNKIATMINAVEDNWVIAQLLKKYPNKITAIGMGELGIMTRLHPWQKISYFAIGFGRDALQGVSTKKIAPGQLTIQEQKLKLYGIIGNPVQHSLSPKLHNSWFKQHNILALYQRWQVKTLHATSLQLMMKIFRFFDLAGASVTMPYKKDIIKYLDSINIHAKKIGAVNTIVRKGNKLIGYNTDWIGVKLVFNPLPCREGGRGKGLRVLILGRGGAAQAVAYAMKKMGAKSINMLSRHDKPDINFDILINATPVRDKLLIPKELLHGKIVMDCNYLPSLKLWQAGGATKLLRVAKKMNAITIDGLPMLINQAKEQFRLWTSRDVARYVSTML